MASNLPHEAPKIYLTGFMGSGKSTVGPLVARRLGWPFLDLDDAIVERAGCSIPAIFEREGERGFRRREAEALQSVSREADTAVVATGGGTLVQEANLQQALRSGLVVYLRVPAEVLAQRLQETAAERPLLQDADGQPLRGAALARHIDALLAERRPFYERAHLSVSAGRGHTPGETAAAITERAQASTGLPGVP